MKIMRFILICLMLFLISFFVIPFKNTEYVSPEYVGMAQKVRADMAEKLSKRHHMLAIGTRGGLMGGVNMLGLSFQIPGPLSKDKLRKILIDCVEGFLIAINADENLRPYLKNYPFTKNEIEMKIFVTDKNGEWLYDPDISVASVIGGKIYFKTEDQNDTVKPYKEVIEEDYETAKLVVTSHADLGISMFKA